MSVLAYQLSGHRPVQLGIVVLQADETLEHDLRRLLPEETELLVTRVPSATSVSSQSLAAMEADLSAAARLLPRGARFAALGFGCTSGTAQIGVSQVAELLRAGADVATVTEPVSALIAACQHLGIKRLALVSPYVAEVSAQLVDVLEGAGIEISAFASFNEAQEANVVRIDASSIANAARVTAVQAPCDGVFLSCTNLRTLDVIAGAEAELGVPVLSSNLVLAWHMARLAGVAQSLRTGAALVAR
ncbi:Asp/Glu racemase [Gymnodinialimonas sp. 57CJ19]|uniref:maleate cis-trans isomerase family protein n=1 Tax=Gymnodinialimonas sp. 57CJ19 TaxID=3138498 RepID=UPI00313441C1